MRYYELISETEEKKDPGTFVGCRLTSESADRLLEWVKKQDIPFTLLKKNELHITVQYSEKAINDYEALGKLEKPTKAKPKKVQPLGNALVITLDCDWLHKRHQYGKELGATSSYPTYRPHVSIVYDDKFSDPKTLSKETKDIIAKMNDQLSELDDIEIGEEYTRKLKD